MLGALKKKAVPGFHVEGPVFGEQLEGLGDAVVPPATTAARRRRRVRIGVGVVAAARGPPPARLRVVHVRLPVRTVRVRERGSAKQ